MFSQEIGAKYQSDAAKLLVAFFNRNAINLIDYVKEREEDRWEANNLRELHTWGMELDVSAYLNIGKTLQEIRFGYTYLNDTLKDAFTLFSRYSINSLKHQFTVNHTSSLTKFMSINSSLRYGQKPNDLSYLVVDVGTQLNFRQFALRISGYNIFNEQYSLTNFIPMPLGNVSISMQYKF